MMNEQEIEKILTEIPKPNVLEGPHRLQLRYSLLHQIKKENKPMGSWKKTLAWAASLILIAAMGVWAGQKIYKTFTFKIGGDKTTEETFTRPDGSTGTVVISKSESVSMSSDDPAYTEEKARKQYEEIQALISQGKWELQEVEESVAGKVYIYKFVLSDGEIVAWGTGRPLSAPDSEAVTHREILDLFAQGKGELIEKKELESGSTVYLYKITRPDGSTFRFGSDTPMEKKK